MQKSLRELASILGGEVVGDDSVIISGIAGIKEAKKGEITFLSNSKYLPLIETTSASAIIVDSSVGHSLKPLIRVKNASLAFIKVVSLFSRLKPCLPSGIHPSAVISKSAKLGKNVSVGACAVIEDSVCIETGCLICAGCFIGAETSIQEGTLIYPNVTIRERVTIGKRTIIHSGSVIGADGFGYDTVDGVHHKIPQLGTVEIGDDVEIGACVTIDRARFDKTIIGSGTKIDNLVQIGHNVEVGENCIIVAQAGISGSTKIGNNVTIAGQAGLAGHISIGNGVTIAAQAGVSKSVPERTIVSGYPAKPHDKAKKINACVNNLPRLYETIAELRKKVEELEKKLLNG